MQKTRKKILVALSGGVDSSVAALILKNKIISVIISVVPLSQPEEPEPLPENLK